MARPLKQGLDYFPLDVDIESDDKIFMIQAEFGNVGFALVIKLFAKIYKNSGYFTKWNEREIKIFSAHNQVDVDYIIKLIGACIRESIFDKGMYEKYHILTSVGIQKRYIEATVRRKEISLLKEYALITINDYRNSKLEFSSEIFDDINTDDTELSETKVDLSEQSKVKEIKEERKNVHDIQPEQIWSLYPNKHGKSKAIKAIPKLIEKYGYEQIERTIKRYINYVENKRSTDFKDFQYQNGSTFFKGTFEDYLDENYSFQELNDNTLQADWEKFDS